MSDVTRILNAIEAGDPQAASQLLPLVYDELRKLAAARMASERVDHTLDATALVHEAYLRLVGGGNRATWSHRRQFFAAAAEAMRRVLVDHARSHRAGKRGGGDETGMISSHFLGVCQQRVMGDRFVSRQSGILAG